MLFLAQFERLQKTKQKMKKDKEEKIKCKVSHLVIVEEKEMRTAVNEDCIRAKVPFRHMENEWICILLHFYTLSIFSVYEI